MFFTTFAPVLTNSLTMMTSKKSRRRGLITLLLTVLSLCTYNDNKAQAETPKKDTLQTFSPGDIVPASVVEKAGAKSFFFSIPIPDNIFALMQGKSFKANCTVPRCSLRYLQCLHVDKDGKIFVGEMVVNKRVADDVLDIFYQLYQAKYPIEKMLLIDYWNADDERAMRDNNSSSFNFRFISHTKTVSKHGKGLAIDINTLYNPYHKVLRNGKEVIEPATGKPYLDRTKKFDYKIEKGDLCYRLFTAKGFKWGGDWSRSKDYQHFELP